MYPYPDIPTATGEYLDRVASLHGVIRKPSETDEQLRKRTRDYVMPGYFGHEEMVEHSYEKKKECECGAHKIGFTAPGIGHSDWCPLFIKM